MTTGLADAKRCPCGTDKLPGPVVERSNSKRKARVLRLRCKACGLTSLSARPARAWDAWNAAVDSEKARRDRAAERRAAT